MSHLRFFCLCVPLLFCTFILPVNGVAGEDESSKPPATTQPAASVGRLPNHSTILKAAHSSKTFQVDGFHEIPATVIDTGILKWIPYESFKSGEYELNIYGDPEAPVGIEIGVYPPSQDKESAQIACKMALMRILPRESDKTALELLGIKPGSTKINGLTVEITSSEAEDAYGAWWIGIYDEAGLDKARATEAEIKQVTQSKADILAQAAEEPVKVTTPTAPQPASSNPSRKTSTAYVPPATTPNTPAYVPGWTRSDLGSSRGGSSGGGRVYVHGYTRKDGTYVQGHTRSAPRRK